MSDGDVAERLAGASILLTGGTGFLGKVVAGTLLRSVPDLGSLIFLIRAEDDEAARLRLVEEVIADESMSAVPPGRLDAMLASGRIVAVAGDISSVHFEEAARKRLRAIDTVVNCAASVSFEEPLDEALQVNALGPAGLARALVALGAEPHFVHVSTAYVSGERTGAISEADPYPCALEDIDAWQTLALALEWRHEEGGGTQRALVERGRHHARSLGWPDTYTMSKAIGEELLRGAAPGSLTIVRPSIIESAVVHPRPGWLEGIKVTDPIILGYASGMIRRFPADVDATLDVVPVDMVANACLAAAAHPPANGVPRAFTVATSSRNPITIGELANIVWSFFSANPVIRKGRPVVVPEPDFQAKAAVLRQVERRERALRIAAAVCHLGPLTRPLERRIRRARKLLGQLRRLVEVYGPYAELTCSFEDLGALLLLAELSDRDRAELGFDTAEIDWKTYFRQGHLPALRELANGHFRQSR